MFQEKNVTELFKVSEMGYVWFVSTFEIVGLITIERFDKIINYNIIILGLTSVIEAGYDVEKQSEISDRTVWQIEEKSRQVFVVRNDAFDNLKNEGTEMEGVAFQGKRTAPMVTKPRHWSPENNREGFYQVCKENIKFTEEF